MMGETEQTKAGLATLVGQLAGDVREVATAEIELMRVRTIGRIGQFKTAAIFFTIAGVLALAALIALLVGLIVTLATVIGPGFATLIVIGVTLVIAAILATLGRNALSRTRGGA